MIDLLDESAHLTMPPHQLEFIGRTAIVDLLFDEARFADYRRVLFLPVFANGEHGFATYIRDPAGAAAARHCIMLFGSATETVSKITGFTEDRIFDLLDLPLTVDHAG